MQSHRCSKGCCSIQISAYSGTKNGSRRLRCRKAGVFIYDPKEERVLLVQSRGYLWGCPKGTLEQGESEVECAIREVKEETGLDVNCENFTQAMRVRRGIYYYSELNRECNPVKVQTHVENNDANGITWIKVECLKKCIIDNHITLNNHCKKAFHRFLGQSFPKTEFKTVTGRQSKRKPRRNK